MATAEVAAPPGPPSETGTRSIPPTSRSTLWVDIDTGLSAAEAADTARRATARTRSRPRSRPRRSQRFLGEYTSYMQLILVGASIVSLAIKEWSTAIVLIVITLVNAFTGLRQQGKAESAMNALKSMMEATARVRRDGAEAEDPGRRQLVVGDVVLIAAGDEVPADGRIVERERAPDRRVGAHRRERARPERTPPRSPTASWAPATSRTWRSCTPRSRTAAAW